MFEAAQSFHGHAPHEPGWEPAGVNPQAGFVGAMVALGVLIVLWIVAVAGGDDILLASANAREIQNADAARLFNIVEEMTIAAGLPKMPRVFIIDTDAPNAFSVGTPENSVVAVTSGLLMHLNRDELQGVIGHEIGHIQNQDTRFMTLAAIMLGAIILIADVFGRVIVLLRPRPAAVFLARFRRRAGRHLRRRAPLRHPRADRGAAFLFRLLAPAGVPGGREFGLVHALPGRARLRPGEDRAHRRPDGQRQPRRRADVRRQSAPGGAGLPASSARIPLPPTASASCARWPAPGWPLTKRPIPNAQGEGLIGPATLSQAADAPVRAAQRRGGEGAAREGARGGGRDPPGERLPLRPMRLRREVEGAAELSPAARSPARAAARKIPSRWAE